MFFSRKKQKPKPVAEPLDLRNTQGSANTSREHLLEKDIRRICAEWFPDNEDNTWRILRMLHTTERSYAEVEPEPKDVGCDTLVFLFEFSSGDVDYAPLAVWCLEGDEYTLLSTAPECKVIPPKQLLW